MIEYAKEIVIALINNGCIKDIESVNFAIDKIYKQLNDTRYPDKK